MVKLVLKLAIFGLIANALYQVVPPFYTSWKFKDALKELATFSQRLSVEEIQDRCVRIAKEHDLALDRTDFTVTKGKPITVIDTSYIVDLKYIPGKPHPYTFVIHAEGDPPRFGSLGP
jgi:hypothetical protein